MRKFHSETTFLEAKTAKEIREKLKISSRSYVSMKILRPLIALDLLEYTNKKFVNESNQKYITKKKENH